MALSAAIAGHSFCARLRSLIESERDPRMQKGFKVDDLFTSVSMMGKGGKVLDDFVLDDFPCIEFKRPDVVILMLGDNDVSFETSHDEIGNRLLALADLLVEKGVRHIVVCQLMSRFRAPRIVLRRMGARTEKNEKRYLEMYNPQVESINSILQAGAAERPHLTYWDHNKKFRAGDPCKFALDGIHLNRVGQYQLYKSLRGALILAARRVSEGRGATAAN